MIGNVPAKLGRYQIVKHLANGGMAQVLLARATGIEGFERHVVVKRIHREQAEDPQFVKMFLDEARLAASLHHANIVQVHDIGREGDEYFFAMEYVHGVDLRELLTLVSSRKEQVPIEHVVTIVVAAASGLHHAHEQRGPDRKPLGLVHRDVSPANILVGYDGTVKVVDFGIAKAAVRTSEATQIGSLKGKVSYMAPEQCHGRLIDRRSDIYALGIVLYELVTVRRLFKAETDYLTMAAIVAGNVPRPSTHRRDIPPTLDAIILKALALAPADRYQTADDLREALEQFAASVGLRASPGALARYLKQLFGERLEPWLVDDDVAVRERSIDFDGSASGAAKVPELPGDVATAGRGAPTPPGTASARKTPAGGTAANRAPTAAAAPAAVRPPTPAPAATGVAAVRAPPSPATPAPSNRTRPPPSPPAPSSPPAAWPWDDDPEDAIIDDGLRTEVASPAEVEAIMAAARDQAPSVKAGATARSAPIATPISTPAPPAGRADWQDKAPAGVAPGGNDANSFGGGIQTGLDSSNLGDGNANAGMTVAAAAAPPTSSDDASRSVMRDDQGFTRPPTASGTPVAWSPTLQPAQTGTWSRRLAIAACVLLVAGLIIVIALHGARGESRPAAPGRDLPADAAGPPDTPRSDPAVVDAPGSRVDKR